MRIIVHQALKDVRLLRWTLAAWALLILAFHAVLIVASRIQVADFDSVSRLSTVQTTFAVLAATGFIVIAGTLVQADSPTRTTAFWLTRPVSRRAMLASKLLLAFVALVVFPILLDAIDFTILGCRIRDFPPLAVAIQFAWLLPFMAVAAMTAGLSQMFLITVFEILVFTGLGAAVSALWTPTTLRDVNIPAALYVTAAFAAVPLTVVYLTRRITASGTLLGVAPVLLVGFLWLWPWSAFVGPLYPEAQRRLVSVTVDRESLQLRRNSNATVVEIPLAVQGQPDGTRLFVTTPRAWLQVGERRVDFGDESSFGFLARSTPARDKQRVVQRLMSPALDGTTLVDAEDRISRYAAQDPHLALYFNRPQFEQVGSLTGTLHVECNLSVHEYRLVAAVAPRPGTTFDTPALRGEVVDAKARGNFAEVKVRVASVGGVGADWTSNPYLLRNSTAKQSVVAAPRLEASLNSPSVRSGILSGLLPVPQSVGLEWRTLFFDVASASGSAAQWLKESQLVVVRDMPAGRIPVAIDIPNVKLADLPVK